MSTTTTNTLTKTPVRLRPAAERGHANFGWLDSWHSFSFGGYHDPRHMGFADLRVINEDRVAGGAGFPTHGHADMEILTYVLDGAVEHKDSLGTFATIRPGEIQRMSAGTGIRHSEYNPDAEKTAHFLQIWVLPERRGLEPGYEQVVYAPGRGVHVIASRSGGEGQVRVHQDLTLLRVDVDAGAPAEVALGPDRVAWAQVTRGEVIIAGQTLSAGDGLAIEGLASFDVASPTRGEALIFDMKR
jgi:quercetin 2,3-dioxygenase